MKKGLLVLALAAFVMMPLTARAGLEEGMTQGDFALWLVKAIGAQGQLPPAPTADDAANFLLKLGVAPDGGWDFDAPVDTAFLESILGETGSGLSFTDLVDKVRAQTRDSLDQGNLGVFRSAASSASASTV